MLNLHVVEGFEPEASTTLDSIAKKSVREVTEETPPFEAIQELPDENLEVEEVGDLPKEKPSEETNVKWLEEPTIVEIKDVKEEEPTPNTNPNLFSPPIQTQSFQTVNHDTAAFLDANRPEPWPNKPSINSNPNRPNPWPNKLPTLTYFIRPKPWPSNHPTLIIFIRPKPWLNKPHIHTNTNRPEPWPNKLPKHTKSSYLHTPNQATFYRPRPWSNGPPKHTEHKQRTSFDESGKLSYKHSEEEVSREGVVSPSSSLHRTRSEGWLQFLAEINRSLKLAQQVSHGEERPRTRSESKFRVFSVASCAPNRFQKRVLTVAQLRVLVIEILRHLPEFEPGDLRSKKVVRRLDFDYDGVLAIFDGIWEGFEGEFKGEVDGAVSLSLGLPLTKPDCLFRVLTVVIRARKLVQHRLCAEIQLPAMKTMSARHFQTFFVEVNQILKKREELEVNQRKEYLIRVSNDLIWEFPRYFVGFDAEEEDLGLSKKKKRFGFQSSCVELKREAARVMSETRSDFIRLALKPSSNH